MSDVEIDKEVKIKRRPQAKIDSALLLSPQGLELLRRQALKRLRLKGRGHEQHDLTQIVELYRLWAHGLYSKASFEDCLALIRKAGSDSALGHVRKEWVAREKQLRRGVQALGGVDFTTAASAISDISSRLHGVNAPESAIDDLNTPELAIDDLDTPELAIDDLDTPELAIGDPHALETAQTAMDRWEDQELYIDQDELDAARELGF